MIKSSKVIYLFECYNSELIYSRIVTHQKYLLKKVKIL